MGKQLLVWTALLLCFVSCNNTGNRSAEQSEAGQTAYNTEAIEEIPGYGEGVAPTDGEPEYIPDGQYAYEDDYSYSDSYSSNDYSEAGSIYDHNGDGEPVRNDQYYYQEGYATGRDRAGFDLEHICENNYEFIKGAYLILCNDATFPDADKTNNGHYQLFKQGFLDGWNSVQGALD